MTPAQNSTAAVDHQAPGLINAPSTGVTAASSDVLKSVGPLVMLTNFILVGLVAVFIGWSAWAVLDEVTVGEGRVIPSRKIQLVQNLEGGIIKEILAREGALVEKGDVVLRIDPTGADAQLGEDREKIIGLDLRARRLTAEIEGRELNFPQGIRESHAELVLGQEQEFASRAQERRAMLASLDDQILQREQQVLETQAKLQGLEKTLSAVRREHGVTAPLVRMGAASRVDVMRLDGRIAELTGELQSTQFALPRHEAAVEEAKNDRQHKQRAWEGKALKELNEVRVELAALRQSQLANQDKVARTDMRAPARGLIKRMYVTTVGQVVKPGMDLIEIVPLDDTLLVQTKIRP
ncbi:MAG: HlyD family type I secretion periplasmic adaptor subunit, partial [Pseudomonadota bacterium]